jgi:hypothetical protein
VGVFRNIMLCRRENCREQKVVYRSLFTAQWKILVGDLELEGKILKSPCISCDVADRIDLAEGA